MTEKELSLLAGKFMQGFDPGPGAKDELIRWLLHRVAKLEQVTTGSQRFGSHFPGISNFPTVDPDPEYPYDPDLPF